MHTRSSSVCKLATSAGQCITFEKGRGSCMRGPLTTCSTQQSGEKGSAGSSLGVSRKHCGVPGRPAALLSSSNTLRSLITSIPCT